jgi:hypothetical protein
VTSCWQDYAVELPSAKEEHNKELAGSHESRAMSGNASNLSSLAQSVPANAQSVVSSIHTTTATTVKQSKQP